MSRHNEIGALGEQIATDFLKNKNYEILERNWRYKKAEIDIIARQNETLIFIEVKTRSYAYFGRPEEFVTSHKEQLVSEAANEYMIQINYDWAIRFDIISIIYKNENEFEIEHFEDAWW